MTRHQDIPLADVQPGDQITVRFTYTEKTVILEANYPGSPSSVSTDAPVVVTAARELPSAPTLRSALVKDPASGCIYQLISPTDERPWQCDGQGEHPHDGEMPSRHTTAEIEEIIAAGGTVLFEGVES